MPHVALNKTSKACQRRINYMIKNSETMKSVGIFLSEIKSNMDVLERFPVPQRGELSREENDQRLKNDFPPLLDYLLDLFKELFINHVDKNGQKFHQNRPRVDL